jgi:hypothetical protein
MVKPTDGLVVVRPPETPAPVPTAAYPALLRRFFTEFELALANELPQQVWMVVHDCSSS